MDIGGVRAALGLSESNKSLISLVLLMNLMGLIRQALYDWGLMDELG